METVTGCVKNSVQLDKVMQALAKILHELEKYLRVVGDLLCTICMGKEFRDFLKVNPFKGGGGRGWPRVTSTRVHMHFPTRSILLII